MPETIPFDFIASHWLLWLILVAVFGTTGLSLAMKETRDGGEGGPTWPAFLFLILAGLSSLALVVAIVVQIMKI